MKYERITNKEDGYICKENINLQIALCLLKSTEDLLEEEIQENNYLKEVLNKTKIIDNKERYQ